MFIFLLIFVILQSLTFQMLNSNGSAFKITLLQYGMVQQYIHPPYLSKTVSLQLRIIWNRYPHWQKFAMIAFIPAFLFDNCTFFS